MKQNDLVNLLIYQFQIIFYKYFLLGTSSGSRSSARAGNPLAAGGTTTATTGAPAAAKKGGGAKDKGADDKTASKQQSQLASSSSITEVQGKDFFCSRLYIFIVELIEEPLSEWLSRELTPNEMEAIINIQKSARGFLQRRILLARTPGTEKNLLIQRVLQSAMTILKTDTAKSASLLFR
jgi:hypothetical protein